MKLYRVWNGDRIVGEYACRLTANHVAEWNIRFGQKFVAIEKL